jgi:ferrous-iron efflux pump FieF
MTVRGSRLTFLSIAGSVGFAALLILVYALYGSQLALAQAADSVSDMLGGAVLVWAVWQSGKPADPEHPFGHQRAEPIAALVVAVLAGVLAAEVLRASVMTLVSGARASLDVAVAGAFAAKILFKGAVAVAAGRLGKQTNPALGALAVDARNDVLVGLVALVGWGVSRAGWPIVDPILAIGIALYVGASGLRLARENIAMLIGESASDARVRALADVVSATPGVHGIEQLVATFHGPTLHVHVDLAVDATLDLTAAHRIAHQVEHELLREADVERVTVHVSPALHPPDPEV